jgi:hypothetical protein
MHNSPIKAIGKLQMKKTLPLRLNGPFPWASERKISRKLPNFLRAAQISLEVVPPKNLVEWST